MQPHPTRGSSAVLLLLGAALLLALGWILFQPSAPVEPLDDGTTPAVSAADGPSEAQVESTPVAETQRSSLLVKAQLTVILSKPGWATLPESVEVELIPQGDTPGEAQLERTRQGGALVEFYDLLFGSYLIRVRALGFATAEVPVQISKEAAAQRQVVALLPAREITGEVRDASGRPVAGIEVSARPIENIPGFVQSTGTTRTDEQGRYHLTPLPEGRFYVHVGPLLHPINDPVEVELYGERVFQDLRVGPLAGVSFEIVDASSEAAIAGARAQIQRISEDGQRGHAQYRSADSQGRIAFEHIPPGEYTVTVLASQYRTSTGTYRIHEGADGQVRIALIPLSRES
ncbi:MAG: hypothetical protein CMJ94_06445 [Planctomycetes bacterium]|nr:hypothetical protein [Planctomycetota bacterium]